MTIYAGMGRFRPSWLNWAKNYMKVFGEVPYPLNLLSDPSCPPFKHHIAVCTCDWSPVNTTTENPAYIVRVDPQCPLHGGDDARDGN